MFCFESHKKFSFSRLKYVKGYLKGFKLPVWIGQNFCSHLLKSEMTLLIFGNIVSTNNLNAADSWRKYCRTLVVPTSDTCTRYQWRIYTPYQPRTDEQLRQSCHTRCFVLTYAIIYVLFMHKKCDQRYKTMYPTDKVINKRKPGKLLGCIADVSVIRR